jgi:acetyltransferase-like isoleucine patch superfamily enzyme
MSRPSVGRFTFYYGAFMSQENDYSVHETAQVDSPVEIGAGTSIWHFCHIMSGAQIGSHCNIGQNVYIDRDVVIGAYAMVGAGAVVTADVPAYALVVGVPGRCVGWVCRCGVRLPDGASELTCTECGDRYRLSDGQLRPLQ